MRAERHLAYGIILLAALLGWTGCDTARNMESPLEKYFLKFVGIDGDQEGVDMVVSGAGSIFLLGNTTSGNDQQLYITRMTPAGIVVWDLILGDSTNKDEAKDIELLSNGTLAVLGAVTDNSGKRDFRILLLNTDGTLIDSVTYGNPLFNEDALSISEITGGLIVSGSTDDVPVNPPPLPPNPGDGFFVRFASDLSLYSGTWTDTGGGNIDLDVAVKTIQVGNLFYVFGHWDQLLNSDAVRDQNTFVWILNATGSTANSALTFDDQLLRGSDFGADDILSSVSVIPPQSGGGYLLSGSSVDPNAASNGQTMFTIKVKPDLFGISDPQLALWLPPRLDPESQTSNATLHTSVFSSQGIGFFVIGCVSNGGEENIYLKKLASNLTDAWTQPTSFIFGGIGNDVPGAVAEAPDGGILVLGTMILGNVDGQRKIVLIKLQPDGRLGE